MTERSYDVLLIGGGIAAFDYEVANGLAVI